jgi:uncharacterized membrane protein (UPF0127 family)
MTFSPGGALGGAVLFAAALAAAGVGSDPKGSVDLRLSEVELADEQAEMKQGLMFRRSLCADCAMIFVFPEARIRSFWMKNTFIPLDIIFLDGEGRIVTIRKNTKPHQKAPTYRSTAPARFVVEVNAGYADRNSLQPGQLIDLEALWDQSVEYRWVEHDGVSP